MERYIQIQKPIKKETDQVNKKERGKTKQQNPRRLQEGEVWSLECWGNCALSDRRRPWRNEGLATSVG